MKTLLTALKQFLFGSPIAKNVPRQRKELAPEATSSNASDESILTPEEIQLKFYQSALMQSKVSGKLAKGEKKQLHLLQLEVKDTAYLSERAPHLPHVIPLLLSSLRNPNSCAADHAKIISQDPAVAANVLRVANSPVFNASGVAIESFQHAIAVLGIDSIRSIALTASIQPIMQTSHKDYPQFGKHLWEHALSTALCAQMLAPKWQLSTFQAYLSGLLHNMGTNIVFSQLINVPDSEVRPSPALIYTAINQFGPRLSTRLAKTWDFDTSIVDAIGSLEQTEEQNSSISMSKLLHISSRLSRVYLLWQHNVIGLEQAKAHFLADKQAPELIEQLHQQMSQQE